MRFSTCETLRSVVFDLKLAWLLLGGLIFWDFRDCKSTLLCCEILTEESQEIIRMIVNRLEIWCEALFLDLEFLLSGGPLGKFWVSERSWIFNEIFWNFWFWRIQILICWRFLCSNLFFNMSIWFCFIFSMTLSTHSLRTRDDFSEQNFYFRRLEDENLKIMKKQ